METLEETKRSHVPEGWRLWLLWVLATAAGGALVGLAIQDIPIYDPFGDNFIDAPYQVFHGILVRLLGSRFGGPLQVALFGGPLGILQWLVLRKQVRRSGWWIAATAIGWAVGYAVGWFGKVEFRWHLPWPIGIVVFGCSVGVAQWLVLRKQVFRSEWWVVASAVGWTLGFIVDYHLGVNQALRAALVGRRSLALSNMVSGAVFLAEGAAVVGVITGAALGWLLRHSAGYVAN